MKARKTIENHELTNLTAPDLVLARYLALDAEIKMLTKEFESIKENLKHQGSHSTTNYVVVVSESQRTQGPSVETLVKTYGESAREICKTVTYQTVKVARKA